MKIGQYQIGKGNKPLIIAEIAQAHEGSLGLAMAYIDAAAQAGADAVKFQTHIAFAESTLDEQFRIPMSGQDSSRYEYWQRMEFTEGQWKQLSEHATDKGLIFMSSAFSKEAVDILDGLDMPVWKLASGEFLSRFLLDKILDTGKPVIVSTGMMSHRDIDDLVQYIQSKGNEYALLQCTSRYPTSFSDSGLNVISELKQKFECSVGLSDHSGTLFPALKALSEGADIIEVHMTFSREMYGPDVSSSLTCEELKFLIKARDAFYEMDQNPVDKDAMSIELADTRKLFARSVALIQDMPEGAVLRESDLVMKKPATGISESQIPEIVGKKLKHFVASNRLLTWEDFD